MVIVLILPAVLAPNRLLRGVGSAVIIIRKIVRMTNREDVLFMLYSFNQHDFGPHRIPTVAESYTRRKGLAQCCPSQW